MNAKSYFFACAASIFVFVESVVAHDRYLLPSHTLLSSEEPRFVTLNASISNDMFHPDKPFGDDGSGRANGFLRNLFSGVDFIVVGPDGKQADPISWRAYARQSIADLPLEKPGTYRLSFVQEPTPFFTYVDTDGARARLFGREDELPEGISKLVRHTTASRVETYVSFNRLNRKSLEPANEGLELILDGHPNDLFVGESAEFQLLINGQPMASGQKVTVTRGGTRHRNQRESQELTTNSDGRVSARFDKAGFYSLKAEYSMPGSDDSGVDYHHYSLFLTLEVFPE